MRAAAVAAMAATSSPSWRASRHFSGVAIWRGSASTSSSSGVALPRRCRPGRPLVQAAASANRLLPSDGGGADGKHGPINVVHLSNLCLDVNVKVDALPGPSRAARLATLRRLEQQQQQKQAEGSGDGLSTSSSSSWEPGGSSNFAIAAARMGMRSSIVGWWGDDVFGDFLQSTLHAEGVQLQRMVPHSHLPLFSPFFSGESLVCWVLVDRITGAHAFASRFDFYDDGPLFRQMTRLTSEAERMVRGAEAVVVNGFVFDEMPLEAVERALSSSSSSSSAPPPSSCSSVFLDIGPRCASAASRASIVGAVALCDVIMCTADEAADITGIRDVGGAVERLFELGRGRVAWVVVKMGREGCALYTQEGRVTRQAALRVEVADTVGCGDSFGVAIVLGFCRARRRERGYSISSEFDHHVGIEAATLALANAVGAGTATGVGAGRQVASMELVCALLEQQRSHPHAKELGALVGRDAKREAEVASAALGLLEDSLGPERWKRAVMLARSRTQRSDHNLTTSLYARHMELSGAI